MTEAAGRTETSGAAGDRAGRALVVGATSAIGAAVAARLADDGFALHLWGRDRARLAATAQVCGRRSAGAAPAPVVDVVDVRSSGALARAAQAVVDRGRLQVVVWVAGAPSSLVYIGSGAAHRAYPDNAAYVAAKHGLAGLAEAVWLDLRRDHVGVTLVSPGLVAAGAGLASPAGRTTPELLLQPADVADAVGHAVGLTTRLGARACPTVIQLQPFVDP